MRGGLTGKGAVTTAAAALALLASPAIAGQTVEGDDGVGDPYFPKAGNTGYDAGHYDLRLRYRRSGRVKTTTLIDATVVTGGPSLSRFNLDFRGPKVTLLEVDGAPAAFEREGQELIVTPDAPLADGSEFEAKVRYRGRPRQVANPDGTRDGWTETDDGAVAVGEPQQSPTWFPLNDHPTDKASYRVALTTPRKLIGISNGELAGSERDRRTRTTVWEQAEPMAGYLAMAAIGRFDTDRGEVAGIPYLGAVDPVFIEKGLKLLRQRTRSAHVFMEGVAGPYPFSATGGVVDEASLGFALEAQGRSYYPSVPSLRLVVHEIAHQWYGNSVSLATWNEIWLNEGFATYMEWLYDERNDGPSTRRHFDRRYEANGPGNTGFWNPPPGDPGGPHNLFADTVYTRGAMALQVLRMEVGDTDFFEVLERWAIENADGNVDTQDLYDLVEDVTGGPRPQAFDDWLYQRGKPARP